MALPKTLYDIHKIIQWTTEVVHDEIFFNVPSNHPSMLLTPCDSVNENGPHGPLCVNAKSSMCGTV